MDITKTTLQYNQEKGKTLKTKPYVLRALYNYRNKVKSENPEKVKQQYKATYQKVKEKLQTDPEFSTEYKTYKNAKNQEYRSNIRTAQQQSRSAMNQQLLDNALVKFSLTTDEKDNLRKEVSNYLKREVEGNTVLHHLVANNKRRLEYVYAVSIHHILSKTNRITVQSTLDKLQMTRPTFISINKHIVQYDIS